MASEPSSPRAQPREWCAEAEQERWRSCHVYYHESLDRLAHDFVLPTVASLWEARSIDSFFFVRYQLGGPHIRLRIRVRPEAGDAVEVEIRQAADRFLRTVPSARAQEEEAVRKMNRAILAADPNETDDGVYPDNTFLAVPFRPEIQRYGGPELFGCSLDFFAVSSVEALCFLANGAPASSKRLTVAASLLSRQALGFASGASEMVSLLAYATTSWGHLFPTILNRADEVFVRQEGLFRGLFRQEIAQVLPEPAAVGPLPLLAEAALRLSRATAGEDGPSRWRIGGSQLHMTANRLGLSNVEEVYLSRLLTRTAERLAESEPDSWAALERALDGRAAARVEAGPGPLHELVPGALARLRGGPP